MGTSPAKTCCSPLSACRYLAPGLLAATLLLGCSSTTPELPDYRQPPASAALPLLARFVSAAQSTDGLECYGAVTEHVDGVPTAIRVLASGGETLCGAAETPASAVATLNKALIALDNGEFAAEHAEVIPEVERGSRILPPFELRQAWLDRNEVFIVGAGLNYADHAKETGRTDPILIPKPVEPTGPYRQIEAVPRRAAGQSGSVCLLDHEVELAFVTLKPIELESLLPKERQITLEERKALWKDLAFFAADDLSDREPIILDKETGFTKAKARPGYLPSGPWLVAGRHLVPWTGTDGGTENLLLRLWLQKAGDDEPVRAQAAWTADMESAPTDILKMLAGRIPVNGDCRNGQICSMPDVEGDERFLVEGSVLPAGSVILTGTPGGTAIKVPGPATMAMLFVRGGFSRSGAAEVYVADQIAQRHELRYLEPGDKVTQEIGYLGRQEWTIGAEQPGSCSAAAPS